MDLTQKQTNYALNLFKGMSQRVAYIEAGYSSNQSLAVIDENAYKLAKHNGIIMRLDELNKAVESPVVMDIAKRKQRLSLLAEEDIENKGIIVRTSNIQAIAELNKMDGVYDSNTVNINSIKIQITYD